MPRLKAETMDDLEVIELKDKEGKSLKFVHGKGWLRDKIIIHRQEGPGGIAPVFVQVNNFAVFIPREVECDLPKPIVQALRNAVRTDTFRDEKLVEFTQDVLRYNFTILEKNVNWDTIMNDEKYAPMNEEYLKLNGEWDKRRSVK